jgi:hypothetical protein
MSESQYSQTGLGSFPLQTSPSFQLTQGSSHGFQPYQSSQGFHPFQPGQGFQPTQGSSYGFQPYQPGQGFQPPRAPKLPFDAPQGSDSKKGFVPPKPGPPKQDFMSGKSGSTSFIPARPDTNKTSPIKPQKVAENAAINLLSKKVEEISMSTRDTKGSIDKILEQFKILNDNIVRIYDHHSKEGSPYVKYLHSEIELLKSRVVTLEAQASPSELSKEHEEIHEEETQEAEEAQDEE